MAMEWDGEDRAASGAEAASGYQLRVLSGRHSGAIMPLPPGRHSLGQDEESDFIFLDDAFLGGRVILDLTGAEPSVEVTGQVKATLEGRELAAGTSSPLPSFLPVEVGATRFAIGPAGSPWPGPTPGADPAAAAEPDDKVEDGHAAPAPDGSPDPDAGAPETSRKASRRRGRRVLAAALVLAALGGLAAWVFPRDSRDPGETLRGILAGMRLPEVRVEAVPGGFKLKGFLRNESERDSLAARLKGFQPPVRTDLVSLEEIRAALQGVLDLYHLQCPVDVGPAGKAVVTCVMDNPGLAKEMSEALRQAAPPGTDLELRLHPASEAYAFVNARLSARVLDHKIHPEARQGRMACVLVRHRMDSLEMDTWNGIRDSFRERFGMELEERWTDRLPPVLARFQNIARLLDAQLVGVTVGDLSYVSLKGRRKYFEGARLAGGISLKSIQRDRIVLGLDDIEQNYFLKRRK